MLHYVFKIIISNGIQVKSAQRYARRVIKCMDIEEEQAEGKKRKTRTVMIEVSGLIHKKIKQGDPNIALFMFQNIYKVYSDIKNKEERNSNMILTSTL